ncbi:MAG: TetR/AcrR family transcriptional regulator [Elusimicrobiaceae bacterium]|nr:TetR/AcrR family transcriptional regulator [Elusimicrobiaceae bacterium]
MAKKENKTSKEEIKLKAFELMARQGIKSISMRQIAEACGVSKPVLYYYFKDKDDLLFQMIKERLDEINKILNQGLEKDLSLQDLLKTLLYSHFIVKSDFKETSSFLLHLSVYVRGNKTLENKLLNIRKEANEAIYKMLNLQYKKGRLTKKNRETGFYLVLAVFSFLSMYSVDKSIKIDKDLINDMANAILKGISFKGGK